MANSRIRTTALDFDSIKTSLKEYLQGQAKFSDYDFEGSGLSILLDVLALNTHYRALYDNLALNEAFLDSASKRASVVSKAKELGYVPSSARSATAVLDVVLVYNLASPPASIELPKYTKFTARVGSATYTFYTTETRLALQTSGNQYVFNGLELKEGTLLQNSFTFDGTNNSFSIPNAGVDTTTLSVIVQENRAASTFDTYTESSTIIDVDSTSLVYFLKEVAGGFHEIEFGNGVVGKALDTGNYITATYLLSSEDAANGARNFTIGSPPAGTTAYLSTVDASYGGSAPESIADIKWNAPRIYSAQNRCVTLDDYRAIVNSMYPTAASINVWGGEQNNPPSYGDVFISIKPEVGEALSDVEKDYLLNDVIGPRKVVTVHPQIVDATYLYVELASAFYYDKNATFRSGADITELVRAAIVNYNNTSLSKFGGILKASALTRVIDAAEDSIQNSIIRVKLRRSVDPTYNLSTTYTLNIGNPIYNSGVAENSILSTGVNILPTGDVVVYFEDSPINSTDGVLHGFYFVKGAKTYILQDNAKKVFGTVDYAEGTIVLTNVVITGIVGERFDFKIQPQSYDVASARNQIVLIDENLLTIEAKYDALADDYDFTSSRD